MERKTLKLKLGDGGFRQTEAAQAFRGRKIEVYDFRHGVVEGRNKGVGSNMSLYLVGRKELHYEDMKAMTVLNPKPKDYELAKGRTLDD